MNEPCFDFEPYGCGWSIGHIWHSIGCIGHLDIVVLLFLLFYAASIAFRLSYTCRAVRDNGEIDRLTRRKLTAEFNRQVRSLDSIAFVSPYLGLSGTCFGIMNAFIGIGMEKHAALVMTTERVVVALFTAGAGLLVAIAANCLSHYMQNFSHLFAGTVTGKFPLRERFSEVPSFALIAAPALGFSLAAFMVFSSLQGSSGFAVALASNPCLSRGDKRFVILEVVGDAKVFINGKSEDWNRLADRLSEIYGNRSRRTLYFSADNTAPFQTVADAIDVAANAVDMRTATPLHITLGLITPAVLASPCPEVH